MIFTLCVFTEASNPKCAKRFQCRSSGIAMLEALEQSANKKFHRVFDDCSSVIAATQNPQDENGVI